MSEAMPRTENAKGLTVLLALAAAIYVTSEILIVVAGDAPDPVTLAASVLLGAGLLNVAYWLGYRRAIADVAEAHRGHA